MSSKYNYFNKNESISLREGFGRALITLAEERDDFYLFDADVAGGTGSKIFADKFPKRTIQFGIAEQNVMAAAAGFSDTGLIPLVVGFGAFTIMRSHEQLRTAVCYGKRNVKICCSHVGLDVGPDGASAQMLEDIAVCRSIPTLKVLVPACANEIQNMLETVIDEPEAVYMRIGRSPTPIIYEQPSPIEIGKLDILQDGDDVSIIACGSRVHASLMAAIKLSEMGINARVINLRSIKPIDRQGIIDCCKQTGAIVTVEDHNVYGGMGSAVAEVVVENCPVPMTILGIKDKFGLSGEHYELFNLYQIDEADIIKACVDIVKKK